MTKASLRSSMKCLQTGSRLTECVNTMVHMDVKHFYECVKVSCRCYGCKL